MELSWAMLGLGETQRAPATAETLVAETGTRWRVPFIHEERAEALERELSGP